MPSGAIARGINGLGDPCVGVVADSELDQVLHPGCLRVLEARLDGAWIAEDTTVESDLRGVWVDAETGLTFAVGSAGTVLRREEPPEEVPTE